MSTNPPRRPESRGARSSQPPRRSGSGAPKASRPSNRPQPKSTAALRTYSSPERSQDHSARERIATMDLSASAEQLGAALAKYGFVLSPDRLELLSRFHALLAERSKTQNLTRIVGLDDMILKHYVDCLMVTRFVTRMPSPLLDLGSGAGFPGVLLKIMDPDAQVILAESVGKKVAFLQEVVATLRLPGLEVVGKSINSEFIRPVQGVITRAVEPISKTLDRCSGCLRPGSYVMFMKGPSVDEEKVEMARFTQRFVEELDFAYQLPGTDYSRRLVVYRRT